LEGWRSRERLIIARTFQEEQDGYRQYIFSKKGEAIKNSKNSNVIIIIDILTIFYAHLAASSYMDINKRWPRSSSPGHNE
jgi:hypothetical protein